LRDIDGDEDASQEGEPDVNMDQNAGRISMNVGSPGGGMPGSMGWRREFWVSDEPDEAVRKTKITLKRLGELTGIVPGSRVEGAVKFGIYRVNLGVTWRAESESAAAGKVADVPTAAGSPAAPPRGRSTLGGALGTTMQLEASCPGARDAPTRESASKSAMERFEEAYYHFDDPNFKPDKLGLVPMVVIGVIILLAGFGLFRTSFVQGLLPKATTSFHAAPAAESGDAQGAPDATPSPADSPDTAGN
jgi:hypothetical protein